jgi:hypothetical protein
VKKTDDHSLSWESRDRIDETGNVTNIGPIIVKRRPPAPAE